MKYLYSTRKQKSWNKINALVDAHAVAGRHRRGPVTERRPQASPFCRVGFICAPGQPGDKRRLDWEVSKRTRSSYENTYRRQRVQRSADVSVICPIETQLLPLCSHRANSNPNRNRTRVVPVCQCVVLAVCDAGVSKTETNDEIRDSSRFLLAECVVVSHDPVPHRKERPAAASTRHL